jgi:radical SAM superfamily enzyme YgiQ (UPF0313 family)
MYDYPPFRPPNEARSALIRITRGCPWNRCTFCAMYKSLSFEQKPLQAIKKDICEARSIYGKVNTIFLGDSDNLLHRDLPEITAFIRKAFPEVKRITSYARARTILRDKLDFLAAVRRAGLGRLHIGLESGDPVVLEKLCKGASPEQMINAGKKAKNAGFEVSFYIISGAGGKSRWKAHAVESGRVLNEARPDFIRLRTLTLQKGTPLYERWDKNKFEPIPPLERLEEVKLFIQTLDLEDCFLASDHLTNFLWAGSSIVYQGVSGLLPDDKQVMIDTIQEAIERVRSSPLQVMDSNHLYRQGILSSL